MQRAGFAFRRSVMGRAHIKRNDYLEALQKFAVQPADMALINTYREARAEVSEMLRRAPTAPCPPPDFDRWRKQIMYPGFVDAVQKVWDSLEWPSLQHATESRPKYYEEMESDLQQHQLVPKDDGAAADAAPMPSVFAAFPAAVEAWKTSKSLTVKQLEADHAKAEHELQGQMGALKKLADYLESSIQRTLEEKAYFPHADRKDMIASNPILRACFINSHRNKTIIKYDIGLRGKQLRPDHIWLNDEDLDDMKKYQAKAKCSVTGRSLTALNHPNQELVNKALMEAIGGNPVDPQLSNDRFYDYVFKIWAEEIERPWLLKVPTSLNVAFKKFEEEHFGHGHH